MAAGIRPCHLFNPVAKRDARYPLLYMCEKHVSQKLKYVDVVW